MKMEYKCLAFLLVLSACALADDAVKNHRADKRQDDSYLFFGGWQPVKSSSQVYQTSASGRYTDLISALPGKYDASAGYYAHALPAATKYYKDIYSYYPRPAIKNTPKKNTPVYMERLKPKRQQGHKQGGKGVAVSSGHPQLIDIQKLELKHLRDLQNILLQTKELPLTKLNIPTNGRKPFEVVELALQPLQQNKLNTGSRSVNRYNRNRGAQRNSKGSYRRVPQNISPVQLPLQFQYVTIPKIKPIVPQISPKQISVTPVKIPHAVPSLDSLLGLKNFQVIEVPVPAGLPINIQSGAINGGSQYGKRNNGHDQQQQYRVAIPQSSQKGFPADTYYTHQAEQPRKHYPASTPSKSSYSGQQQHQIEAELVKLSDEEIQELLKSLQIVKKNSQDFLKILPIAEANHKSRNEQVHLVLALPQGNHEQNSETSAYESQNVGGTYDNKEPYVAIPQDYPSQSSASISYNSGGYQISNQNHGIEHSASGYQIDDQGRHPYEKYQTLDGKAGYIQKPYEEVGSSKGPEYSQPDYQADTQQGVKAHREQYLEVITPPVNANGYRREPVLAVEIQKGQTIEDAIKSIDPQTLQRLGAHGKDGLEIEVVEVPVEEYSAESKKAETYVASSNSTTKPEAKVTTTAAPALKEKSTTTEKKS